MIDDDHNDYAFTANRLAGGIMFPECSCICACTL